MSDIKEIIRLIKAKPENLAKVSEKALVNMLDAASDTEAGELLATILQYPLKCSEKVVRVLFRVFGYEDSVAEFDDTNGCGEELPYKIRTKRSGQLETLIGAYRAEVAHLHEQPQALVDSILYHLPAVETWAFIQANPALVEAISDGMVEKLHSSWSPYKVPLQNQGGESMLFCYTNLRQRYMRRLTMTSLISYLYRCAREFDFYDTEYGGAADYIPDLALYNPDVEACQKNTVLNPTPLPDNAPPEALEEEHQKNMREEKRKARLAASDLAKLGGATVSESADDILLSEREMKARNRAVKKLLLGFLDEHFEFDPDRHVASSYKKPDPAVDADRNPTLPAGTVIPSFDTFKRWELYEESNYDKLRELTNDMYEEKPELEFAILPLTTVKDSFEETKFREKYEKRLRVEITSVKMWSWTYLDARKGNRDRVKYTDRKMELIEQMIKNGREEEKLYNDMLTKRVSGARKKNEKKHGKVDPAVYNMGTNKQLMDYGVKSIKELESKDEECPDGAVEVNVMTLKTDMEAGETVLEEAKFFTEEEPVESVNVKRE